MMLAFSDVGSGTAIVFLPGITCSREHWQPVVDLLQGKYRCILIDPPGHGDSPAGPMDVMQQAALVCEVVDHLGLDRPILAGHSAGGIVATVYAMLAPCKGVFSIEGTLDFTGPFARDVYRHRDLLLDPAHFNEGFWKVIEPMRPELIPEARREWALSRVGATPSVVLDAWRDLLEGRGAELNAQLEAALPSLRVPLLVLWGEEPPPGETKMVRLAPAGSTEAWPGLGHFIHLVDPKRTAERLHHFADNLTQGYRPS